MTCWAIIPARAPGEGKSRLAGALDAQERKALVSAMLEHVAGTVGSAKNIARTCIFGPSRHNLPDDIPLLADPGTELNIALRSALAEVARENISRVVVVAADLPQLTVQDVQLLAVVPEGTVGIAPDRHETGTNALSLPLPEAATFRFAFGTDSFALHNLEAERLGLKVEIIHSPGLAHDIDVPADLPDARGLMQRPG